MQLGLGISVLMHAALMAWALVSLSAPRKPDIPDSPSVAVDMISPSELAKIQQGVQQAKLKEAEAREAPRPEAPPKEVPLPKVVTPPPPPPPPSPPPAAVEPPPAKAEPPPKAADSIADKLASLPPPPEPGPTPEEALRREEQSKAAEEKKKAEDDRKKTEDKKKAEDKKRLDDKRKAEEKKKTDDKKAEDKRKKDFEDMQRRLAALEDKAPPKVAPAEAPPPSTPIKQKGPVLGDTKGRDKQLSADKLGLIRTLMRQAIRDGRCWNINAGGEGVDKIMVEVEVRLNRDGTIYGTPKIANAGSSPLFRDMADSAVRALVKCAPFRLPADLYEGGWQHMIVEFDPREMF